MSQKKDVTVFEKPKISFILIFLRIEAYKKPDSRFKDQ